MPNLPKGIKIYRKFRYRKGYGVHSPFVYNLITKVIEEKSPYYIFDEIESIREKTVNKHDIHNKIIIHDEQHKKYGALLFRLVNFFQCKGVLQIGSPKGIMTLYLASTSCNCKCLVVEENKANGKFVQKVANLASLENIRIETGDYQIKIDELLSKEPVFDLIFINISENKACAKIIDDCVRYAKKGMILVIDGINKNNDIKNAWKELVENPKVSVSIDLYALGIAFFKENIHKQHHKTHFDDGKKQTLYKNRRQRFHIFSRRKKSTKNTHPIGRLRND